MRYINPFIELIGIKIPVISKVIAVVIIKFSVLFAALIVKLVELIYGQSVRIRIYKLLEFILLDAFDSSICQIELAVNLHGIGIFAVNIVPIIHKQELQTL